MDLVLDGVGIGPWGGIGGHVYLEARGKVWIEAPHVQHVVASTYDSASVNVSVTVGGGASAAAVALRVVYVDPNNKTVGQTHVACTSSPRCTVPDIMLGGSPPLWSPSTPMQHTAFIEMTSSDGSIVYDREAVRFGLRQLDVDGIHWKLNGRWLYLHGCGDDSIFMYSILRLNAILVLEFFGLATHNVSITLQPQVRRRLDLPHHGRAAGRLRLL